MDRVSLSAFQLLSDDRRWTDAVVESLPDGYAVERRGPGFDAWRSDERRRLPGGAYWADGWQARRVWLVRGRQALGVRPFRVYLRPDGSRDRRPERFIVDFDDRPRVRLTDRRRALLRFLAALRAAGGRVLGDPVALEDAESYLLAGVSLCGAKGVFPAETDPAEVHERAQFFDAPTSFEVQVCCETGVDGSHADDYARRATEAFAQRGVTARFRHVTLEHMEDHLADLDEGSDPPPRDIPTLFMLQDRPVEMSVRMLYLTNGLERHRIPWRRAYATDDRERAVPDQVGSLLQAAGGHPHAVRLAGGNALPWSLGLDLARRGDAVRVGAALIAPDGRLAGGWTVDAHDAERAERDLLRRLMLAAAEVIPDRDRDDGVLVLRDGRVPEPSAADDYLEDLGAPSTLVGIRRFDNPPLLLGDLAADLTTDDAPGAGAWPPETPAIGWLPGVAGGAVGFLVTYPQAANDEFDNVTRVEVRDDWNQLDLSRHHLARILAAQALTPGLGLHRRVMPAPIYWAHGIAGASESDLRFRGQGIVPLD